MTCDWLYYLMVPLAIVLITALFAFFVTPASALRRKARHSSKVPELETNQRNELMTSVATLGGYKLRLVQDGQFVFDEEMTMFHWGFFHIIKGAGKTLEILTVCKHPWALNGGWYHRRFVGCAQSVLELHKMS